MFVVTKTAVHEWRTKVGRKIKVLMVWCSSCRLRVLGGFRVQRDCRVRVQSIAFSAKDKSRLQHNHLLHSDSNIPDACLCCTYSQHRLKIYCVVTSRGKAANCNQLNHPRLTVSWLLWKKAHSLWIWRSHVRLGWVRLVWFCGPAFVITSLSLTTGAT